MSGAKNAVLVCMAAALLTPETVVRLLRNKQPQVAEDQLLTLFK